MTNWTDRDDYEQSLAEHHALLESLDGPEPDDGWTDEQLAADEARVRAMHADDNPNDRNPGSPFPAPLEWI